MPEDPPPWRSHARRRLRSRPRCTRAWRALGPPTRCGSGRGGRPAAGRLPRSAQALRSPIGGHHHRLGGTDARRHAVARQLTGEQMRLRAVGLDWPLQGASMAGLARLDDLQRVRGGIVEDGVAGDLIEAGTWRGGAGILMQRDARHARAVRRTEPSGWRTRSRASRPGREGLSAQLSQSDFLSVPEQEVRDNFARLGCDTGRALRARLLRGHPLAASAIRPGRSCAWTETATRPRGCALEALYPQPGDGGYLIVDDYVVSQECREAVDDYRREHGISEPLEPVDWSCVRWRRRRSGPASPPPPGLRSRSRSRPRRQALSVPTALEVELEGKLAHLRSGWRPRRSGAAEARAECERVRASVRDVRQLARHAAAAPGRPPGARTPATGGANARTAPTSESTRCCRRPVGPVDDEVGDPQRDAAPYRPRPARARPSTRACSGRGPADFRSSRRSGSACPAAIGSSPRRAGL